MTRIDLTTRAAGHCQVMGVVNVTPDSFSDGGQWLSPDAAIAHGLELISQGASIVDVGGESTRPGATRVGLDEELRRVIPVVEGLASAGAAVSVDTMWAATARAALDAGAAMVNDVSGGRADPDMLGLVAEADVPFVVMHWRAHSARMQNHTDYADVVADVLSEIRTQIDVAIAAGVREEQIVIDPGLGFSKTGVQNWELLAQLPQLTALGFPVLVAASRKGFLGALLANDGVPRPVGQRDAATAAISLLSEQAGAWCVRVHDVLSTVDALAVSARVSEAHDALLPHPSRNAENEVSS